MDFPNGSRAMAADLFEFGKYRLDSRSRMLFRGTEPVALAPKAAELLVVLVQAAGKVLSREELLRRLWPDTVVEEGSLTSHISLLRKILGQDSNEQDFIQTLSKRGYRFVGAVKRLEPAELAGNDYSEMLLVLPFENLSEGERYDYFSDGLTEEMITELARLSPRFLGVIARTTSMQFKAAPKTVAQIGRELNVSHVLEGSVRRLGKRVRITVQLIRVSDETHLWAPNYERDLDEVLEVQSEVARAVGRQIQIRLTPEQEHRLVKDQTRSINAQAHELYLRGRHHWYRRTEEGLRKSIQCFEEALAHEPKFAAAYDGISDAHTMLACRGMTAAHESFHKAKAAARYAVQLQPTLGEGYASLAHVRLHDWDWVGLENEFRQSVELDPGYAIAHYWYAEYLMAMGRSQEALIRVERGSQLDPLNSVLNSSVGMICYLAHDYDGALKALKRGLEIDPTHNVSYLRMGLVCLQKSRPDEAIEAMRKAVMHSGGSTETLAGLAQAHGVKGDRLAMDTILNELGSSTDRYVSPYNMARAYAASNDNHRALEWLERAYREHNPDLIELTREPAFERLRADAKFLDLAQRIGWPGSINS
jgi:TolB-like protein